MEPSRTVRFRKYHNIPVVDWDGSDIQNEKLAKGEREKEREEKRVREGQRGMESGG